MPPSKLFSLVGEGKSKHVVTLWILWGKNITDNSNKELKDKTCMFLPHFIKNTRSKVGTTQFILPLSHTHNLLTKDHAVNVKLSVLEVKCVIQ